MGTRIPMIVHLDADAFFVSVEQVCDPSLRGRKCAVGGTTRGIISSASYEARACGVYTPMPTTQALRVCPDLILIPHSSGLYGRYSERMFELCETLTPLVQRNSIDEGYLDLSPCRFPSSEAVQAAVSNLQLRLWEEIGIPVSMGIASNKMVAQIASKLRKPRGFVVVPPGQEADFLAPLSVGKLPGVGAKTEAHLSAAGIRLVSDLLIRSEDELRSLLGSYWRDTLAAARGHDDRPVETIDEEAKSYSQQETFPRDIGEFAQIERIAKGMIDSLMVKVRSEGHRVRTLTVKVRYADFSQESHGQSLPEASDIEAPFYPLVAPLLRAAWRKRQPLRLLSVRLSAVEGASGQMELFSGIDDKRRRLASVVDRLNRNTSDGEAVKHGHQLAKTRRIP